MSNERATSDLNPRKPSQVLPGERIGHFRVIRFLGKGGMGRVFLARDTMLGRKVALKLIQDRVNTSRFVAEARATARFNHPHIVTLYMVGSYRGSPYLALEYLPGQTLRERIKTHPPLFGEAIQIAIEIASALSEAHVHGIAHLDLKPANMITPADGRLRVLDFGLAQTTTRTAEGPDSQSSGICGTPAYMAPEQWTNTSVGTAADVWALGVILYEMLSGKRPFRSYESTNQALKKQVVGLDPIPQLNIPEDAAALLMACLARKPEERPLAAEVEQHLRALLSPHRPNAGAAADRPRNTNPFRGLRPFEADQAALFFGREAEISELVERLRRDPVVPVVGASGVGKSSLIRAGLIPRLMGQGAWKVLDLRPGPRPLESIKAALAGLDRPLPSNQETQDVIEPSALITHPERLCLELEEHAQTSDTRLLIYVDQMEEAFTLSDDPAVADAFLRAIAGAADDPQGRVRVVFTLRNDYFTRAAETHPLVSEVLRRALFLQVPGRAALVQTLTAPLETTGYRYDDGLVEKMIEDSGPEASLPLLQFTARQLWEARDEASQRLTEAAYDRIGGVSGALIQHGDRVLDALGSRDMKIARDLLLRMVTSERTRRVISSAEILEGLGAPARPVLDALIAARLVTTTRLQTNRGDTAAFELAHESLIRNWDRLKTWVDAKQEDLRFLTEAKEAAEIWAKRGRRSDEVWTRGALVEAKDMLTKCTLPVPDLVKAFIDAGHASEHRRIVQRRAFMTGVVLFLLIVSSILFVQRRDALRGWNLAQANHARAETHRARAEADRAEAQKKAAGARNASRLAGATLYRSDPALVLALVREMEPTGALPAQWRQLARWATHQTLAEQVVTHQAAIWSASLSPDGKRIVTTPWDKTVQVWNLEDTDTPITLRGHTDIIYTARFSPDGTRIVTASRDKTVRVYNADGSGTPLVLQGHTYPVWFATFHPDGNRIISGSSDKTARIWSMDGSEPPRILEGHEGSVYCVNFSRDGTRIVTASADHTARVWDENDLRLIRVFRGHTDRVQFASFSPDGTRIVTASLDKTARVYNTDGSGTPIVLKGHQESLRTARFSSDGTRVLTASFDKTARIWDVNGSRPPIILRGHQDSIRSAEFSLDGTRIITASFDKTARVWTSEGIRTPLTLRGHDGLVRTAAFSPDGGRIVTASDDTTARIYFIDGSKPPIVLRGHEGPVRAALFSPDGTRVATASRDGMVRIYPADGSGEPIVLRGHEGQVYSAAFHPDGTRIVTSSSDKTVRIFNADGSGTPQILPSHQDVIYSAAFSPDGTRIATASRDQTARVYTIDGSQPPLVLRGHQGSVYSVAFAPKGNQLLTAAFDKTARLWNLDRRNPDGSFPFIELLGHKEAVGAGTPGGVGAFGQNGQVLTFSDDKTLRIWKTDKIGAPFVLSLPDVEAWSAAFSPDGTRIVTTSHRERNPATGKLEHWATVWDNFEPFTGLDDPALWTATRYCPPVKLRVELLAVSPEEAEAQRKRCRERVEAGFQALAKTSAP